jgi:hypothetical protein
MSFLSGTAELEHIYFKIQLYDHFSKKRRGEEGESNLITSSGTKTNHQTSPNRSAFLIIIRLSLYRNIFRFRISSMPSSEFADYVLKNMISSSMQHLFGLLGASIAVDILHVDVDEKRAIIRAPIQWTVQLWSSLTLFTTYERFECVFIVEAVSPFLTTLSAPSSREYARSLVKMTQQSMQTDSRQQQQQQTKLT